MVTENENTQQNQEMARLYDESISDIKEGEILKGKIVQLDEKDILVDIGFKSEGIVHKSEVTDPEDLKVGGEIDVMLEAKENDHGMVVLSYEKAKKLKGWRNIMENHKEGDHIEGRVSRKVRGGFMVDIGMEAFLPASLSVMQEYGGADNLVGEKLEFKIVKINVPRKNIVLSRKEIVDEKRREEKQAIMEELNKGDLVKGVVRNITDFGAFIDIGGGITGLLHITDMSWGRINHPSEVLSIGDETEVMVLDFDKTAVKVSLGLKQKFPNPWEEVNEKYPEGTVVTGKVVNIMPYGVFVELEKGIEGLIHISEFSWSKKFNHPSEKFSVGDEVKVMVLRVDKENQKLSLGIKQLEKDPWEGVEERYSVGETIKGTINAITDYGAFIELEKGVEGLIHVSDLSWTKRVTHPRDVLTKGSQVDAVILNVDEQNRRIALGIKQLGQDPWDDISQKYQTGTVSDGKITNITNFGVFVELEDELEGLLHVSEIDLAPGQKIEDVYKPGDPVTVAVIHIDGVQKKIALTQKDVEQRSSGEEEKPEQVEGDTSEESSVSPEAAGSGEGSPEGETGEGASEQAEREAADTEEDPQAGKDASEETTSGEEK